nr:pirin family protein [uncultured Draconibacterium sp.]
METILKTQNLTSPWQTDSPFIFCAHHNDQFPKGNEDLGPAVSLHNRKLGSDFSNTNGFSMYHGKIVPGFPAHPHVGFETVTIVLKGTVDHFDSSKSTGRYANGDVQWLTTGKGCMHSEMFPLLNTVAPNPLKLFQIWLNLPAKNKKANPYYKMFWNEEIPVIDFKDDNNKNVNVRIIAGEFNGHKSLKPNPDSWASDQENHVSILLLKMDPFSQIKLPAVSNTLNRNIYFYSEEGNINIDGQKIESQTRVKLKGDEEITIENGPLQSEILVLEGEPINEPVVNYGPFIANSEAELKEIFHEYQKTEFGGWPWDKPDQVHSRNTGRFAKYSDGRLEKK